MAHELTDYLAGLPVFEGVDRETLDGLAQRTVVARYEPGELLLEAGEPGAVLGIVRKGWAQAVADYGTSAPRSLDSIEANQVFGEYSLMSGENTAAAVVALTVTEALLLPSEEVSQVIAANRPSVQYLSRLIAARMRQAAAAPQQKTTRPRYAFGATAPMRILVVNCGSSSLKYTYYDTGSESPVARGLVERIGTSDAQHIYRGPSGERRESVANADHRKALAAAAAALTASGDGVIDKLSDLSVIGHRVVHGGETHDAPVPVSDSVKETIRRNAGLAPLHNPLNLLGIEVCEELAPDVPQVAVFDTAFHQKMPPRAHRYAIPSNLAQDKGLRRYGFHGMSHEFVGRLAADHLDRAFGSLRLITCHLGNGVSMTAIEHGRSIDTSMGLTPLEGLVMGTRSGDVDPGLLLHLMREENMTVAEVDEMLNKESGLKALSGISSDMRELESAADAGHREALIAIQCFCYRAKKYLGAYMAALGGADAIVFTGGIGQGSAGVRARICQGLAGMGILLREDANRAASVHPGQAATISDADSRVEVLVVGTDEERMIAREAVGAVQKMGVTQVLQQKVNRPIPIGVSAHHVHLTREHVETLFGPGHELTWYADLTQPGQFACKETVTLVGPKARIERVRVLGPERSRTQVEISRTEEFKLGIDAPIRASGDLDDSLGLRLEGPAGSVEIENGVINALRHIHMSPEDALEFALRDRDIVRVEVEGERPLVFGGVLVRVKPDYRLEMHIDTDEANAAEIKVGATCHLDSIQERPTAQ